MPKQKGLIKIVGKLDGFSFYASEGEYLVRTLGGASAHRIKTHPGMQGSRDAFNEFGVASSHAGLMRKAFKLLWKRVANPARYRYHAGVMRNAALADTSGERGKRTASGGNLSLLEGFEFNDKTPFSTVFSARIHTEVDKENCTFLIEIPSFDPRLSVKAPAGATLFRLHCWGSAIDFDGHSFSTRNADSGYLPLDVPVAEPLRFDLKPEPRAGSCLFLAVGIDFGQEVNGTVYDLKDRSGNCGCWVRAQKCNR